MVLSCNLWSFERGLKWFDRALESQGYFGPSTCPPLGLGIDAYEKHEETRRTQPWKS